MKKALIILTLILLSLSLATASDLSFEEVSSTTIIEPGEIGEYTLKVTNTDSYLLQLQFKADPFVGLPTNDFEYIRIDPNYYELEGHESMEINVTMKLREDAQTQKRYKSYITAEALNRDVEAQYNLQVFAMEPAEPITIYIKDVPETISPGTDLALTVSLENNMHENLNNVEIKISSDLFEEEQTIQLFEDQERELEFTFPIETSTDAEEYTLSVRVYYEDELKATSTQDFTVELYEDVSEKIEDIDNFLYRQIKVTKTNNGNAVVGESYDLDLSFIERLFVSHSVDPTYTDSTGAHWSFNLDPAEETVIVSTVDYRPIFIAIIVIILFALIAMYWMSKGVIIKKSVFKLKQTTEGISKLKIMLHLKNNTNKTVKDVMLIDILPRIINPSTHFGTLRPNNIERGSKGVRLIWKIPELVKGEERVISYEVEARMKVFGTFSLPSAMVRYKNKGKKVINSKSNTLSLVSGYVEEKKRKR